MEFGAAFPSDGEPFEVVEQGEGLLHDVAELAHTLDVRGALAGDDRQDPAFAKLVAVGVGVVALVAEQGIGASAWPATGGMPSTRARVWLTSLTFAAVVMNLSGVPSPSQIKWCLLPVFRRSTGDGPVSEPPFFRADMRAVHASPRPVEVVGRVQFGQQDPVQLVEDPCLLPALQASPAGLPGAEPQLQRQELSGYVVVEDVQDALQAESVRQPKAPPTCSTASGSNPSNVSAKLNPASSSSSVFQEDARIPTCSPRPHVALCFHREQDLGLLRA
ncbi:MULTISPECIES: hypothetical protein [Streptomyces]|uniref:hypothetical protein n=1 Tax=Streptomyces sp. 12257 TaxID=3041009 RepID=UPI0021F11244|nr:MULTISPECIES: hypothetical protein [Streptomyces]MDI5904330.1 hypothetical protein [Streptomyces sp. 12257]